MANLLIVGDSLTVGTLPYLRKRRSVDGVGLGGWSSSRLTPVLRRLVRDRHQAVIYDAGTNDLDPKAYHSQLRTVNRIVGDRQLILATLNKPPAMNRVVRKFAADSGATVIEWRDRSHRPGILAGDGIHATGNGYRVRASMFLDAIGAGGERTSTPDGEAATTGGSSRTRRIPYEFSRGSADKDEDSWTCMGRLAEEVNWRRFMRAGVLWYASEDWLRKQRPTYTISENTAGVHGIQFGWDTRRKAAEATVSVVARRYDVLPGDVWVLEDTGAATDKWIVSSFRRGLTSQIAEVSLHRPQPKLDEPPAQTETITTVKVAGVPQKRGDGRGDSDGPKDALDQVKIRPKYWGGSKSLFTQFIHPFMKRHGLSPGSQKRTATSSIGSSTDSDHHVSQRQAYACDYGTYNGLRAATALNKALGGVNFQMNTYNSGNIRVDGYTFRIQILWGGGVDHGDHVHVGAERA